MRFSPIVGSPTLRTEHSALVTPLVTVFRDTLAQVQYRGFQTGCKFDLAIRITNLPNFGI